MSLAGFMNTLRVSKKDIGDGSTKFDGLWRSESADGIDGFLRELEVSNRFAKIAAKYGGNQIHTLDIDQRGDRFTLVSKNERRELEICFTVGVAFVMENERGNPVTCLVTWEDPSSRDVLLNTTTDEAAKNVVVIRRQIVDQDTIKETMFVNGRKDNGYSRTYLKMN